MAWWQRARRERNIQRESECERERKRENARARARARETERKGERETGTGARDAIDLPHQPGSCSAAPRNLTGDIILSSCRRYLAAAERNKDHHQ